MIIFSFWTFVCADNACKGVPVLRLAHITQWNSIWTLQQFCEDWCVGGCPFFSLGSFSGHSLDVTLFKLRLKHLSINFQSADWIQLLRLIFNRMNHNTFPSRVQSTECGGKVGIIIIDIEQNKRLEKKQTAELISALTGNKRKTI